MKYLQKNISTDGLTKTRGTTNDNTDKTIQIPMWTPLKLFNAIHHLMIRNLLLIIKNWIRWWRRWSHSPSIGHWNILDISHCLVSDHSFIHVLLCYAYQVLPWMHRMSRILHIHEFLQQMTCEYEGGRDLSKRNGLAEFRLLVNSPADKSPLIEGVWGSATNLGTPAGLVALGYVPK